MSSFVFHRRKTTANLENIEQPSAVPTSVSDIRYVVMFPNWSASKLKLTGSHFPVNLRERERIV